MSVVKPKPKLSLWLITKNKDDLVNQSKFEAYTRSWYKARENVRERVTIGFGAEIGASFLNQLLSEVKTKATANSFHAQLKPALLNSFVELTRKIHDEKFNKCLTARKPAMRRSPLSVNSSLSTQSKPLKTYGNVMISKL